MMKKFEHISSRKNNGEPSAYSPEQRALNEAFVAFHESGGYEWSELTITKLPCDAREHYPDLCWHYRIIIQR